MTTATIAKPTAPAIKAAPKPAPAAPAVDVEQLRTQWTKAVESEAVIQSAFDAAKLGLDNSRVYRSRIAYIAAMVTPVKGEANLLNAARILLTDPADTPAKRTAQAKSRKNTLRNYVEAGKALQAAGLVNNITEPDDNERKITADVFRELNKRDKAEAKGKGKPDMDGTDGDTDTDGGTTAPESEAMTFAEVLAQLARFGNALDVYTKNGGIVTQSDADTVNNVFADMSAKLAELAA